MRVARLIAIMNLQAWSDHALNAVNSTATIVGLVAGAIVLVCVGLMYFSGSELAVRMKRGNLAVTSALPTRQAAPSASPNGETASPKPENGNVSRVAALEKELTVARTAAQEKSSRLSEVEGKLGALQRSQEAGAARIAQLEKDLATARRTEESKSKTLAQIEGTLNETRRDEEAKAARLAELEAELAKAHESEVKNASRVAELEVALKTAKQNAEQTRIAGARTEAEVSPRRITPDQRKQFLEAIRGMPTGKVLVSAFFENKETHEFGTDLLALLKQAGFNAVERVPVNFFTTSRPSSGVRIGCQDMSHPPPHFATVRKGLETMGLDVPNTSIVNAGEADVVEIQITPTQ